MIYVVIGDVRSLQALTLERIQKDNSEREAEVFFGPECTAKQLQEACVTLSLWSAASLVIVKAADQLPKKEQTLLIPFFERVPDQTCLVFVADKIDRRLKFWQTLLGQAEVISCEAPPPRDRRSWLQQECRRRGLKIGSDALQAVTETALADFNQALLLLDKIALYLGDSNQIDRDVVELCSSGSLASKIFDCTEAIGAGQWERALVLLQTLWTHRESPLAVLALLLRHYRILLKAVENPRLWGQRQEMARILGVPPFAVERYVEQARDYQRADLLGLWELFAQTDRRLKSSASVKEWEFEQLIFDLRQRRGAQQVSRN